MSVYLYASLCDFVSIDLLMIVKMIQNLGNRMEKIQETFNKDLEELKSKQTMMNTQ